MSITNKSLNNRIYQLLSKWKYNIEILELKLDIETRRWRYLNIILIIFALLSIVGWFQFEELKRLWSFILVMVQMVRILKNQLFVNEEMMLDMQKSLNFYLNSLESLERLYYDFYAKELTIKTVKKKYEILKDSEISLLQNQKFRKISKNKKLILEAEKDTDVYLEKLKNNLENE